METAKRTATTPSKSRIARVFSKVLRSSHSSITGSIAPVDGLQKVKTREKIREVKPPEKIKVELLNGVKPNNNKPAEKREDEERSKRIAREALLAKIFASISSIKAAYAQLQLAQSPYDAEGIQLSDELVVSELKALSEMKQCFLKKQFDPFPEKAFLSAEVQEQKSLVKTYEVMSKKLESQFKLKESEITFLKEKLEESRKENRAIEKRLNSSGSLSVLDNLHMSGLSPNHFIPVLRHAVRSVRTFVKLMVTEMRSAGWDLHSAVHVIHPGVKYFQQEHMCFAFESYVCREMFDCFHIPNFGLPNEPLPENKQRRRLFFERFTELKSVKAKEYLCQKPKSTFGKFCRAKYLKLIHPKMEASLFGNNLAQRNTIQAGEYFPETNFFCSYAEMAKRIWLLHCLAFSFDPVASVFQFRRGCRYSEVYMESVSDEAFSPETEPRVAFTVVPGFKIGKTVIQSQVYLSEAE